MVVVTKLERTVAKFFPCCGCERIAGKDHHINGCPVKARGRAMALAKELLRREKAKR